MSKNRKNKTGEALDQQLTSYAVMSATVPARKDSKAWLVYGAASAALVVGSAAEASVMYTSGLPIIIGGSAGTHTGYLDIDGYGTDFGFRVINVTNGTSSFGKVEGFGLTEGNLIASSDFRALNYTNSDRVGPVVFTEGFQGTKGEGVEIGTDINVLGVNFVGQSGGGIHAGWIQVDVNTGPKGAPIGLEIIRAAWETTPDTAIHVSVSEPEATWLLGLGLLAMGATGIRRMRKNREAEA